MKPVRAKKHLGQHFLTDENIAENIVNALITKGENVLELGPGTGVLTKYLINKKEINLKVIELDRESVKYLKENFPKLKNNIIEADFLKINLSDIFNSSFDLIGNFPYNISSQIFFKVLEYKDNIPMIVGMLQKEVAERISAKPGSKTYGILSVFLSAYYDIEYLFTVPENVFNPPPKVKSGVIRLTRNNVKKLDCNEKLFFRIVKTTFNQRRKTISNSIKPIDFDRSNILEIELFKKRPEQLSVNDFVELTNYVEQNQNNNIK